MHTERNSKPERPTQHGDAARASERRCRTFTETLQSENIHIRFSPGGKQRHSQTPETTAGYRGEVVISRLIEAFCGFKCGSKADIFCY